MLLSDAGLYATGGFAEAVHYAGRWSVFDWFAGPTAVRVVLAGALVLCAVLMIRPTKMTGISCLALLFACVASLNARAPFAISSAEMYLAVVLFWAMLGSIVGWSRHTLRAFRVQVAVVYLSPLVIRLFRGGDSWIDGSALRRVVDNPDLRRGPLGSLVRPLPDATLSVATWGTLAIEAAVVVLFVGLVVAPDRLPTSIRRRIVGSAVMLHLCIGLVCGLWFFSAIAIIGLIAAVRLEEAVATTSRGWFVPWAVAACVAVWSFLSVSESPSVAAAEQRNIASYVVRGAGITQVWGVFAPNPPRAERWVEIADDTADVLVDSRTETERIRKLAQNVRSRPDGLLARAWLATLCATGTSRVEVVVRGPGVASVGASLGCPSGP